MVQTFGYKFAILKIIRRDPPSCHTSFSSAFDELYIRLSSTGRIIVWHGLSTIDTLCGYFGLYSVKCVLTKK
jgi:hypothetical protein